MRTPSTIGRRTLLTGAAATGLWLSTVSAQRITQIVIDPSRRFQTMSGWEVTADLADRPTEFPSHPFEEEMLDRVISEVGINRIRLEIRAGVEDTSGVIGRFLSGELDYEAWKPMHHQAVNDNADPFVANPAGFDFGELDWHIEKTVSPLRERIAARGERLFVNVCYVCFVLEPHLHANPEEYAEFVLQTYRHMEARWGYVPDSWEVILEPDNTAPFTGPVIGRAVAAAGRRLKQNGYRPAFIVPSVTDMRNALPYMRQITAVPGALEHISEFAYHRYRGSSRRRLRAIAREAAALGVATAMLELWFGLATHHILHEDLEIGNVSAWQGSVVRSNHEVIEGPDGQKKLVLASSMRFNALYFRTVRAGARRLAASSSAPGGFAPLAFVNRDGGHVLIVKSSGAGPVRIEGLPGGAYRTVFLSETQDGDLGSLAARTGTATQVDIPDEGVLAIQPA